LNAAINLLPRLHFKAVFLSMAEVLNLFWVFAQVIMVIEWSVQ
jgi:hypothetical protein